MAAASPWRASNRIAAVCSTMNRHTFPCPHTHTYASSPYLQVCELVIIHSLFLSHESHLPAPTCSPLPPLCLRLLHSFSLPPSYSLHSLSLSLSSSPCHHQVLSLSLSLRLSLILSLSLSLSLSFSPSLSVTLSLFSFGLSQSVSLSPSPQRNRPFHSFLLTLGAPLPLIPLVVATPGAMLSQTLPPPPSRTVYPLVDSETLPASRIIPMPTRCSPIYRFSPPSCPPADNHRFSPPPLNGARGRERRRDGRKEGSKVTEEEWSGGRGTLWTFNISREGQTRRE